MAPDAPVAGRNPGLSKEDRIRSRAEFLRAYRSSAPIFTSKLVFYACSNERGRRRLGCTVPKKVGNAVQRNRLKRLMREAFRGEGWRLPEDCDLVINAKAKAAGMTLEEVRSALVRAAERLQEKGYLQCDT
ncbi:MAG: ribonuclease P protein component [Acidobacteriota bacterium]|jgi:ribonuclease P protein component